MFFVCLGRSYITDSPPESAEKNLALTLQARQTHATLQFFKLSHTRLYTCKTTDATKPSFLIKSPETSMAMHLGCSGGAGLGMLLAWPAKRGEGVHETCTANFVLGGGPGKGKGICARHWHSEFRA